jgi:glycosyltransferase involved in cell wall biosynthesis
MSTGPDISVVISTYNRSAVLPHALSSILDQDATDCPYEVIVVDNNSTDNTRAVIESFLERGARELRYAFEERQGVSYGRNAGIALARAPILAFFDDDIVVPRDWLTTIKAILNDHPEADFVGGKVLPLWTVAPPSWLTQVNWSPLALVDYGPQPLHVGAERQLCLVGANLAVRRSLFDSIGLFSPDLQRVKDSIGSMEDHELLIRSWRAGKRGLYAPNLIVRTEVPARRMTKQYHRRWHREHGAFCAAIPTPEDFDPIGRDGTVNQSVTFFGVPACLYRELVEETCRLMISWLRRQQDLSFMHENKLRFLASYIIARHRQERTRRSRPAISEAGNFVSGLVRKKVRNALAGGEPAIGMTKPGSESRG